MKTILLASASMLAFSGAAFADGHATPNEADVLVFTGDVTLGYNDTDQGIGDENGFYWGADLDASMSVALDNGLTATATFGLEIADDNDGGDLGVDVGAGDFTLSLTGANAGLVFGDTTSAADTHWSSAGDMEADGFSSNDGETYLRGDVNFGGVDASVSYIIDDEDGDAGDQLEQLSLGVAGDFGSVSFALAYQEESDYANGSGDFNGDEILGLSVGTSFSGADVTIAYADNGTSGASSLGLKAAYPVGPVVVTGYYVLEDGGANEDDNMGINVAYSDGPVAVTLDYQDDQGTQIIAVDGSYDLGNGLTILAGFNSTEDLDEEFYAAASFDLGGGATLLAAFADGNDDEIGSPEYEDGTTVQVSFEF